MVDKRGEMVILASSPDGAHALRCVSISTTQTARGRDRSNRRGCAMATGRAPGFRHNEDTRKKIQAAQLINRLQQHVYSDVPILDASQVNAAKSLLNKVLPDLKPVDENGDSATKIEMTVTIGG